MKKILIGIGLFCLLGYTVSCATGKSFLPDFNLFKADMESAIKFQAKEIVGLQANVTTNAKDISAVKVEMTTTIGVMKNQVKVLGDKVTNINTGGDYNSTDLMKYIVGALILFLTKYMYANFKKDKLIIKLMRDITFYSLELASRVNEKEKDEIMIKRKSIVSKEKP